MMNKSIFFIWACVMCSSCAANNSISIEQLIKQHKVIIKSSVKDERFRNIFYYSKPEISDFICRTKVVEVEAEYQATIGSFNFHEKREYDLVRVNNSNEEALVVCDYVDLSNSTFEVNSKIDTIKLVEVLELFKKIIEGKAPEVKVEYESEHLKSMLDSVSTRDIVEVSERNRTYILHFMEYDSFFKIIIELGKPITAKVVY